MEGTKLPYQTVSMVMDPLYIGLFGQGKCILRRQSECIRWGSHSVFRTMGCHQWWLEAFWSFK